MEVSVKDFMSRKGYEERMLARIAELELTRRPPHGDVMTYSTTFWQKGYEERDARIAELEKLLVEAREVWLTLLWDDDLDIYTEDDSSVANFKRRIDEALGAT